MQAKHKTKQRDKEIQLEADSSSDAESVSDIEVIEPVLASVATPA